MVLGYSSQGGNGFVGVGWGLSGFGTVERASKGRGTPRFDGSDVYYLGGQELVPCAAADPNPSCSTGGTHVTKQESYVRVLFDGGANRWTVWSKDGTRTIFDPVYQIAAGTVTWGQTSRVDTHDNAVSYAWACLGGDCYPDAVTLGPYSVTLYRETRPDILSRASGSANSMRTTSYRLRSILVKLETSPIRAYELSYSTSGATGASRLTQVTQYGKDVVIDGAGQITGGTALPPHVFTYQGDSSNRGFASWPEEETVQEPWIPPSGFPGDTPNTGTGADGPLAVGSGAPVYVDGTRAALAQSSLSGSTTLSVTGVVGSFVAGNEVLIIQMAGPTSGRYEARTLDAVTGTTLTLATPLAFDFGAGATDKTQVVRIPNHTTVTVHSGGTLTAHAWDGSTGGVAFFRATGAVLVESGGVLTVAGLGFSGGTGGTVSGLASNGGNGGLGGQGDAINTSCGSPVGYCDSCTEPPCKNIVGGAGVAAWSGSGAPVQAGSCGRSCNQHWCYGGDGGGGGISGNPGAAANPGQTGAGQAGGPAGAGGTNPSTGALLLLGGGGGGGHGGMQGVGAGGGGGGGGGARRSYPNLGDGSAGSAGGKGGQGGAGGLGGPGGGILVVTADSIVVAGAVSAAGASATSAAAGSPGEAGGAGGSGGSGVNNAYGDARGVQGEGGRGAAGGTGGSGGGGGAGGIVSLRATQIDTSGGTVVVVGGNGGNGAAGGVGGAGGAGPVTRGPGPGGVVGTNGTPGKTGRLLTQII